MAVQCSCKLAARNLVMLANFRPSKVILKAIVWMRSCCQVLFTSLKEHFSEVLANFFYYFDKLVWHIRTIGEINTTLFTEAGCKLSVFKYGTWWRWRISCSKLVCWDCAFCDHTEINCLFLLSFGCHLIELRTISISQTLITYYCSHFLARCGKLFSSWWWCARTLAVLQKVRVLRMIGRNLLMI